MRDKLPLAVMILFGILGFSDRFIPHPVWVGFNAFLRNKMLIVISIFALVLGLGNLLIHHVNRIKKKGLYWQHSWTLIISFVVAGIIGLLGGPNGDLWMPTHIKGFKFDIFTIYLQAIMPLQSTMFALLAFYMASAAYRSFRARNAMAVLLLVSAFVVMLGQVPVGQLLFSKLPAVSQWIMGVPNTAAKRGIDLGITLGALATMLKILTGVERSWMGGGR
jgi:hypothetical protein